MKTTTTIDMRDRALAATRLLFSGEREVSITAHVEALGLLEEHQREPQARRVAELLAEHPAALEQARMVVRAFLSRPPSRDTVPDPGDEDMPVDDKDGDAPAIAAIPGGPQPPAYAMRQRSRPAMHMKQTRQEPRSLSEIENAVKVLCHAIRLNESLAPAVIQAEEALRSLAKRVGDDTSARAALQSWASKLEAHRSAAGTLEPEHEAGDRAVVFSAGGPQGHRVVDDEHKFRVAMTAAAEYRDLRARGYRLTMTAAEYVQFTTLTR